MSNFHIPSVSRCLVTICPLVLSLAGCVTESPSSRPQAQAEPQAVGPQALQQPVAAPKPASATNIAPAAPLTCAGRGTIVLVDLDARRLLLCHKGAAEHVYPIALGSKGIGKRKEGDRLTPIGSYPLGSPYVSKEFGPFVPIGYPTKAQVKAGYTGNSVGIHAPHRQDRDKGAFNTGGNWTAGCISVGSDPEAEEIVQFVKQRRPRTVSLETRRQVP